MTDAAIAVPHAIADWISEWRSFGFRATVGGYGASRETLERRVRYGGRKGRRAARRLSRGQWCHAGVGVGGCWVLPASAASKHGEGDETGNDTNRGTT